MAAFAVKGIEALVRVMWLHKDVAGVAEAGCGALCNIAALGGCRAVVCAR